MLNPVHAYVKTQWRPEKIKKCLTTLYNNPNIRPDAKAVITDCYQQFDSVLSKTIDGRRVMTKSATAVIEQFVPRCNSLRRAINNGTSDVFMGSNVSGERLKQIVEDKTDKMNLKDAMWSIIPGVGFLRRAIF